MTSTIDVKKKQDLKKWLEMPYNNRELSWLDFNARVLEEAFEKENPIMERCNFLSITASNLDEFFMVRVAGVLDNIHRGTNKPDPSGLTPKMQMKKISEKVHAFAEKQYNCYNRSIIPSLRANGINFVKADEMTDEQKAFADDYFQRVVFPVLTPMAVDTSRPFPLLANKSLNIAVLLTNAEGDEFYALVQVPSILPRFLELPAKGKRDFITLERIITIHLGELFELYNIKQSAAFRITRDSDLDIDEDTEDLMEEIKKSIKKRQRGVPVRLEFSKKCHKSIRKFLVDALHVTEDEIYVQHGPLDLTFLSKFARIKGCEKLCFEPITPVNPPAEFYDCDDIFEAIREKDRLVHHPYESFDVVVDFVKKAAKDQNVLAIKQTLYRVSGNSPIVAALIKAAENGKQVTVLVELKARFDEENNIQWATKLEKAGCHVIYGLTGLKTHCKICLVVRKDKDGIRRYLHMGTGNYNDSTARFYTDIGMFTCREEYGLDASSLFNTLTGYSLPPEYNKFIVAPQGMRPFFEEMIRKEIENAKHGLPASITAKVNSLVDPAIISLLYEASQAGVKIELIVRGICCLIPGLKGWSENIKVISIVGQLLEHSRIFKFENNGNPLYYLGSADWMQRNLDRRVELVFPVEDEDIKNRVEQILKVTLKDTVNARKQLPDTTYHLVDKRGKKRLNSQKHFSKLAQQAQNAVKKQTYVRTVGTPMVPAKEGEKAE
ncbi:RNA degradosome polyphosphate kinase [Ruminococcus sp.]|uniref:RNA degradosome polyphosphate kinase n=1 Tax=Ruminococcus sp. TaxID=41978 RepID=UPI003AACFA8A